MIPRNISHEYYYKFSNIQRRLFMSLCVFALVVGSGLMLTLMDFGSYATVHQSGANSPEPRRLQLHPSALAAGDNENCVSFNLKGSEALYEVFQGIGTCRKQSIRELNLEFVNLDAKMFTESLQGCTNLESITLNGVRLLNEDFRRVYLPKLSQFTFERTISFHEQYRDYVNYTTPEKLLSTLFFDKKQNHTLELRETILNSKVNIILRIDGWTVISVQNSSDAILALQYANEILKNAQTNYLSNQIKSLTLTECSVVESSIPRHLSYLNFYNVAVQNGSLTKIIDSMDSLQSLFIEAPLTEINLHHLPQTINKISFSSINLTYSEGDSINASSLALGFISDSKIFQNFHTLFPAVENVAIFEPGSEAHVLLLNILKTKAKWVLFKDFPRKNENGLIEQRTQVEIDMEIFLNVLKIPVDEKNFLIERNDQNIWTGRSVDLEEGLELRYQLLGWEKYITVKAYRELY